MKKLIIFDFWGTLVENGVRPSPSKQVQYFLRARMPFSEFITTFEHSFMTKKWDNLREGFEAVADDFNLRLPDFVFEKLIGMWNKFSILSKPFDETIEVLEDLKKDYRLVILSNTDNFSLPQVIEKYDLQKYFEKVYLSCETGKLKSEASAFTDVFKELGVSADEAIMVGDSPQSDIKGAQNAGVESVLIDRRGWYEGGPSISSLLELRGFLEGTLPAESEAVIDEQEE